MSQPAPAAGRRTGVLLLLGALLLGGIARGETALAGLTLAEAFDVLRERGLRVAYTGQLVRPEMRVASEPEASEPAAILDEILAPHGLAAEAGPGGLYVVVARAEAAMPPAGIRGRVSDRRGARPLADVQVLVLDTERREVTGDDGGFEVPDLVPGTYTLEARRPGFVVERRDVEVVVGRVTDVVLVLEPAKIPLDEIIVTPSLVSLLRTDPVAALAFDRDEILALPHLGDDLFRAMTLVPGTSSNELSAEIHVRGGRADEVMVMLDNLELFEPFHLQDFDNALSIIAPQAIGEVDLILGGIPAQYGDRMGGVIDMSTVAPERGRATQLGLSLLGVEAGSSGGFRDGRGRWLAVARSGSFELLEEYLSPEEQPRFWDAFAKLEHQLGPRGTLGLRVLHADDSLEFDVVEDVTDRERVRTDYGNSYVWLTHQALVGARLFLQSAASLGRVERDRSLLEDDGEEGATLSDRRLLEAAGFKQDWSLRADERHYLKWGFDVRSLETEYDYFNLRELEDLLGDIRGIPREGTTEFRDRITGEQYAVYAADRIRLLEPLTVELGLRYDEQTVTDDRDLSPRVNLVWAVGEASTLRAAWGHYHQSQRPYELQVEDGETDFFPAELTEDYVAGFERLFPGGVHLRLNLYRRDIVGPRVRYENLFEPIDSFPELAPDRARIVPERSSSEGAELFARGKAGPKVDWWVSYTYSRIRDSIDGRKVPRSIDQPHAVNLDLNYRVSRHWTVNLAWRYHTGWPTTAVSGRLEEDDEGELEPVHVFGPINGERLTPYHRLDLRVSRQWKLKKGELTFFLDVQNLYDRENLAGFDAELELEVTPDDQVEVLKVEEAWGGILPSFGIDWKF